MALSQDFAKMIEGQIAVWQAQIEEHQKQLGQAGAEAPAGYEKAGSTMRENAEQARKLLQQVRDAGESARQDVQASSLEAFERLQKGRADALGRLF